MDPHTIMAELYDTAINLAFGNVQARIERLTQNLSDTSNRSNNADEARAMNSLREQNSSDASDVVIINSAPIPESLIITPCVQNPSGGVSRDGRGEEEMTSMFRNLSADDPNPEITEIESLCIQCGENGLTKLMLTKIPFYKEVVLMSFRCNSCHWENNELQSASQLQEKGVQYKLRVKTVKDLGRQIVKTEWASISVPELQFEVPPCTQDGSVTTIEGVLQRALDGLKTKLDDPEVKGTDRALQLKTFLLNLRNLIKGNVPFTFILRDCSGNSFLENIFAPQNDTNMEVIHFERDKEENNMLGIMNRESDSTDGNGPDSTPEESNNMKDEVLQIPTNCSFCGVPTFTNMKMTEIPHFKTVIIMATTCDSCGNKTCEVKSGSGIEPLGKKISLRITSADDLRRYLVKSDTCCISIAELDLEVGAAALGGRYTTVEGILTNMKEQLRDCNSLLCGDSAEPGRKERMSEFLSKLDEVIDGRTIATLVLDDPCGNSFLEEYTINDVGRQENYPFSGASSIMGSSSTTDDSNLTVTEYERTKEQDDELGITDMKTENYEEL